MRSTDVLPFYMFVYMVCVHVRLSSFHVSEWAHVCMLLLCVYVYMCLYVCVCMRLMLRTFLDLTHLHPVH